MYTYLWVRVLLVITTSLLLDHFVEKYCHKWSQWKSSNCLCVKFRKAQRDKNCITRCATAVSKVSMWHKWSQNTVGKLQPENYYKTTSTLPFLSLWAFPDFTTQTFTTLFIYWLYFCQYFSQEWVITGKTCMQRYGRYSSCVATCHWQEPQTRETPREQHWHEAANYTQGLKYVHSRFVLHDSSTYS